MSQSQHEARSFEDLPAAKIERNWKTHLIWLVPIVAGGLAAWFIYSNLFNSGPTLHIFFDNAAGLQAGKSSLKYRGADIGHVTKVRLSEDQRRVDVAVSLNHSAEGLARAGSRFWIVKPEVGVEQITGLRTIVSGDYITVEPGSGKFQDHFDGLVGAPVVEPQGMLRILLLAEKADSLKARTPGFYRGIQVGEVFSLDLGHKSQTIQITVDIQTRYAPLVRMNSKFWNAGGIKMNLSLSGLNIAAQSLESLVSGGIAFATPDLTEQEAPRETSFRLYDKPEDAWLSWSPPIELDETNHAANSTTNSAK
jgi:paraquat-inducible protein B